MNPRPSRHRAGTLLELMAVMTILGLLVPILFDGLIALFLIKDATIAHAGHLTIQRQLLDKISSDVRGARRVLAEPPEWAVAAPASAPQTRAQGASTQPATPLPPARYLALDMPNGSQVVYRWVPLHRERGSKKPGRLQRLDKDPADEKPYVINESESVWQAQWVRGPSGTVRTELWLQTRFGSRRMRLYAVALARPRAEGGRP